MFKTFFTPKWVLLAIFVVVFSYFAFTLLAPWQLGKDHRIVERNKEIETAYQQDPIPLSDAVNADGSMKNEWTRVLLHGRYLPNAEVLLRLRPVDSGPTYQSLVPFADDSGLTMLVDRGWIAAGEGNAVPSIAPAPSGDVSVIAILRAAESTQGSSQPIKDQGYQQVYVINPGQVGQLTGTQLGQDYLQISNEDQPGSLEYIPVPQLDRGSHLSYGFQWIAFGIMAPLELVYFVYAELRERRRDREENAAMAAVECAVDDRPPLDDATPSRRSQSRYGDAKPDFYEKISARFKDRY